MQTNCTSELEIKDMKQTSFFSTASSNLVGIKPDSIILELKVPGPVPGGLCSIRWLDVGAA